MHVAIAWNHKLLLLLATALLPNRNTALFENEAGPPYDKQRIQMGLRAGNTVLISFRSGVSHFQCVLIALSADLHTNKQKQGQHKFWKYVSPLRTAWLPERLARTYCSAALDKCSEIPYGEVHHLQRRDEDEKHSFVFQNIYHIGDTKSAWELEIFLCMSREGCNCAVDSSALTGSILMDHASDRSSILQLLNCYGLLSESLRLHIKR